MILKTTNWLLLLIVYCALTCVSISAATLHVWQDSPSPVAPFTNWATAAHVIQDAVDAAAAGDSVLVTNGFYAVGGWPSLYPHEGFAHLGKLSNRVYALRPVTIRSVNGPDARRLAGRQRRPVGVGKKKGLNIRPQKGSNTLVKEQLDGGGKSATGRASALQIQVAHSAAAWRQAKAALGREHGLGAGREAGDRLCQLVKEDGRLVAVLVWCAAAWHVQARDQTVGWDAVTRSKRLKLVVQLRRFLVLAATRPRFYPLSLPLSHPTS